MKARNEAHTGNVVGQDDPRNYRNLKHGLNAERTYTCRQKAMSFAHDIESIS